MTGAGVLRPRLVATVGIGRDSTCEGLRPEQEISVARLRISLATRKWAAYTSSSFKSIWPMALWSAIEMFGIDLRVDLCCGPD